jgi:hypothetical protein
MKTVLSPEEIAHARACPLMRVRTAAQIYTGLNRNRIYTLMHVGTLPYVVIGNQKFPKTEALERLAREGVPA